MYNIPMEKKQIKIINDLEFRLLDHIQSPGRYIGGEINQIVKDLSKTKLNIALCFPDVYEVGMSNSGIQIIYEALNRQANIAAERVFSQWTDAEDIMREKSIPLFTLENKARVSDFDIIGFSLSNELCYTNMLNILDLAGLKTRTRNRNENDPIVIAGGGMSNNCEPIADFIDLFILGEGEQAALELANLVINMKKTSASKAEILKAAHEKFDWAYVPQFYEFQYSNDKITSILPDRKLQNAVVDDLDSTVALEKPIVPFIDTIHERITIEVMRGCPGRCRFCQASFTRRPIRFRSVDRIVEIAKNAYHNTGFDTVSLLSLSTADYPQLEQLLENMFAYFRPKHVGVSLPSLRVDQQLHLLPKFVSNVRKSGLTIAVEAASEKLRRVINKPLTDQDLFAAVDAAYAAGWSKLKLYFMVGFPGETEEDIQRIVDLSYDLARARKRVAKRPADLNVAISWLVPKPHTPFGWLGQKSRQYFQNAKSLILQRKRELRANFLQIKFHDIDRSALESAIGRGDRRLADVIETAWKNGAKFDLWDEFFEFEKWQNAFVENGFNMDEIAQKAFGFDEILPWNHLGGPKQSYLQGHYTDAMNLV